MFLALHTENAKALARMAYERDELSFVLAISGVVLLIKIVLLAMTMTVRTAIEEAVGGASSAAGSARQELTESLTDDASSSSSSSSSHEPSGAQQGGGSAGSSLPKVLSFIGGDGNMWVKTVYILVTAQLLVAILSAVGTSDYRDDVSPVALLLCFFGLHAKHKQSLLVFGVALFWFFFTDLIVRTPPAASAFGSSKGRYSTRVSPRSCCMRGRGRDFPPRAGP